RSPSNVTHFSFSFFSSHAPHPALPPFPTRRSSDLHARVRAPGGAHPGARPARRQPGAVWALPAGAARHRDPARDRADPRAVHPRSEEHTSELQSLAYLVCRLLLEKKKKKIKQKQIP